MDEHSVLNGYCLGPMLGEGGMSRVYAADATATGQTVAIKVLRTDRVAPEQRAAMLERFRREARALAQLRHPHILRLRDYGEQEGEPYFVTDRITGGTLRDRISQPWAWSAGVRLVRTVAGALAYAHHAGVIHRDVKPANILMTPDGNPILADFGVARILQNDSAPGQVTLSMTGVGIGTPEYMAPEQALGRKIDGRADVYALGVVLYELVTGRRPFASDTPMGIVLGHLNAAPTAPRQLVPQLPAGVERVILRALAKQPTARYPTMDAFAAALSALLNPAPVPWIELAGAVTGLTFMVVAAGIGLGGARPAAPLPPAATATAVPTIAAGVPSDTPLPTPTAYPDHREALADVQGRLIWPGGEPESLLVHLNRLGPSQQVITPTAAAEGALMWEGVPPGHYQLAVEAAEHLPLVRDIVIQGPMVDLGTLLLTRTDLNITQTRQVKDATGTSLEVSWRAWSDSGATVVYQVDVISEDRAIERHSGPLFNRTTAKISLPTATPGNLVITVRALVYFERQGQPTTVILSEGTRRFEGAQP